VIFGFNEFAEINFENSQRSPLIAWLRLRQTKTERERERERVKLDIRQLNIPPLVLVSESFQALSDGV